MSQRLAAIVAILGAAVAIGTGTFVFVDEFPLGLVVFAGVALGLGAAWFALLHRGSARIIASLVVLALFAGAIVALLDGDNHGLLFVVTIALLVGVAAARVAFRPDRSLPPASPPRHPVLFVNPRSGDGRAEKVGLVEAARERGLETVVLEPGQDLGGTSETR